ncbi:SGNH/GDSL hydrolase family protein [Sorangium sp. So ce302]|uniref:SGNH/GDSL hydrolase family protein n=1 Tax=Sorangium sp. So ce302 TaxID=3133297 RepID=UPI003F640CED
MVQENGSLCGSRERNDAEIRRPRRSTWATLVGTAALVAMFSGCSDDPEGATSTSSGAGASATTGATSEGVTSGGVTSGSAGGGVATSGSTGSGGGDGGGTGGAGEAGSGGMGGASDGVGGTTGDGGAAGGSAGAGGGPSFQPCPASGSCKIMPFGDSITQGFNVAGGYRAPLFHLALEANRDITFVGSASDYSVPMVDGVTFPRNHEGHGGWTIEGNNGIAQLVGTSIPNYKPNIITLMIGTNDINGNINLADAPNRLGKLLDSIFMRDPNILVVLAQIVPTRTDGTNNAIKAYNAAMPDLVSTRVSKGQHIVLVDMYTAFTNDTNYRQSLLGDNLHPNQAGYNRMAEVWFQALSPYLR